ncbi:MAG: SRPBCC family protein [Myxococcota bacterium]|nr:aromatic ring-hydroxylating dioxygenase subunit alpha [Myxococcota bacterium]
MQTPWAIDADITKAETLPGQAYTDPRIFEQSREKVFAASWQLLSDLGRVGAPGAVCPTRFIDGWIEEPLLFTRDLEGGLHCVSNVCTHRGNLVCEQEGVERALKCRYHGRRFRHDGGFVSMPEFEGVQAFPSRKDDLPRVAFGEWKNLLFASLAPAQPFAELIAFLQARVGWLPLENAKLDRARSRSYDIAANWALYCDNYLEGFHIPYVHAGLNRVIDYGDYRTELFDGGTLQIGTAKKAEHAFTLPRSSPDHGELVAAYYFWLFPNTMLNFYPWGLSVNRVKPRAVDRTTVEYLTYVWDATRLDQGAGSGLDQVEKEDQEVVVSVQHGVRSRLYDRGRYSPTRETGLHHFHRMLTQSLNA